MGKFDDLYNKIIKEAKEITEKFNKQDEESLTEITTDYQNYPAEMSEDFSDMQDEETSDEETSDEETPDKELENKDYTNTKNNNVDDNEKALKEISNKAQNEQEADKEDKQDEDCCKNGKCSCKK